MNAMSITLCRSISWLAKGKERKRVTKMERVQTKYIMPMGLNAHEWRDFYDLMIRANDMQLEVMSRQIADEMKKRDL